MIGCSGVIVFKSDLTETCIVSTKRGHMGFPKGKRHGVKKINKMIEKGKLVDFDTKKLKDKSFIGESYLETAFRELKEETGIKKEFIDLIKNKDGECIFVDELSNNGNPCTRYFIGILKNEHNNHKFIFDEDELQKVEWYNLEKIKDLDKLKKRRKDILNKATDLISISGQ